MTPARWQRLQELFDALLALPEAERAAWLAQQGDPADVQREALALVAADAASDAASSPITRELRDAASQLDAALPPGTRLGPWRLLRELGSGGMGTVFLAERADDSFRQQVAIKLLRGVPTRAAAERMRRERQILADLVHPHIARLLDGGESADGQPYLVMEYIEGRGLLEHAAGLPVAGRVRLLQQIAGAVHFAHQRLVVHRDLKPANVLVRSDGSPVLLDFGIAKLLDAEEAGHAPTQAWFTPGYASPEQRRGEPVSTATDVYALGALLAEVLSGQFAAPNAAGVVVPPSRRGLAGLSRPRQRELDAIVERATEPEAARRYPSAEAFAADLQRYLRHKPIKAGPDRAGYRVAKFLRRHRYAALVALGVALLALGFTWRLAVERNRARAAEVQARRESAAAENVVDYLTSLFEEAAPERAGARTIAPRDLIDRGLAALDTRLGAQPQQRARLLAALGDIYLRLGLVDPATAALEQAVALQRRMDAADARIGPTLYQLGRAYQLAERYDLASARYEDARREYERHDAAPAQMAELLGDLGPSLAHLGRIQEGLSAARNAVALAELAYGDQGDRLAFALMPLAETLRLAGQLDEARQHAERAVALLRAHRAQDDPDLVTALGHLSEVLRDQGEGGREIALLREMLAARSARYPADSQLIITVRNNLATALYMQGDVRGAADEFAAIVQILRPQAGADRTRYLIPLNNLASIREQMGDYAGAERALREVLDLSEAADGAHDDPRFVTFRQNLGRTLMLEGKLDEAWPLLSRDIPGSSDASEIRMERARQLLHEGEWMRRRGRHADAHAYLARAAAAFDALYPQPHARHGSIARAQGLLLRDEGRLAEAEAALRRASEILDAKAGRAAPAAVEAKIDLADVLLRLGRGAEALALLDAVAQPLRDKFVPEAPARRLHEQLHRQAARG